MNNYEFSHKKRVVSRNSKLYILVILREDDLIVQITGRIDGIEGEGDSRILIETKNRRNRLFNEIRMYERVQMTIYMKMTGITSSKLLEYYNDEEGVLDLDYDEDLWNEINKKLLDFKDSIIQSL